MKPTASVAFATWILQHLTFGPARDALVGDLLEQLHSGRSAAWYWRQVLSALGVAAWSAVRAWAAPLVFSAGWSMVYPAWRAISRTWLPHAVPNHWLLLSWPRPEMLELGCGMVPTLTFVWIGYLLFLVFRRDIIHELSALRLLAGLSASLNVLLLSTLVLLHHVRNSQPGLLAVTREDFYTSFHFSTISIPVALSIFMAICRVLPRAQRPPRQRRLSRTWMAKFMLGKYRTHAVTHGTGSAPGAPLMREELRLAVH
jgi:hypothetical protein